MKVFCSALTATLLVGMSTSIAQTTAPIRWAEGAANASSDVANGVKVEGLKTDDVQVYTSFDEIKETEYNRAWVDIFNHAKAPISFDPQSTILVSERDKTVRAEALSKAASSIQKFGEAKSQELASAHCPNMIATQCQPTVSQMQVSKQVAAYSAQQAQWVRDNGLTEKTLAPGQEAKGYIVFKKDKKKSNYILKVTVGTQVFEFPVAADNKAPSFD